LEESIVLSNRFRSNLIFSLFTSNPAILGGITKLSNYL